MWQNILRFIIEFLSKFLTKDVLESTPVLQELEEINDQPETISEPEPMEEQIKIIEAYLPPDQYLHSESVKNAIVLHHTVSPSNSVNGDLQWWKDDPRRVGAHFIIDRFGNIYQCVPLDKWIHHLAVSMGSNKISFKYKSKELNDELNSQTIGIELDNAGGLVPRNDNWISSYNKKIPNDEVWKFDYRGYKAFEMYYPAQIESLKELILHLMNKFPVIKEGLKDNYKDIFNINLDALNGKPGIYTHTSYRTDKSDCSPQPILIEMLNSLKNES